MSNFWNVLGPALLGGAGAYAGARLGGRPIWAGVGGFAGALAGGLLFNNHRDYSPYQHYSQPHYFGYQHPSYTSPWYGGTTTASAYASASANTGYYQHSPFAFNCGC